MPGGVAGERLYKVAPYADWPLGIKKLVGWAKRSVPTIRSTP
jgi:hypothetical protein